MVKFIPLNVGADGGWGVAGEGNTQRTIYQNPSVPPNGIH